VRIAVRCWASHTAEIEAEIDAEIDAADAAEEAWLHERQLLARDR
jgi:RecB family exonuclease